jgi:hypothetical protein
MHRLLATLVRLFLEFFEYQNPLVTEINVKS